MRCDISPGKMSKAVHVEEVAGRWPDVRIVGPIEHRIGVRFSGMVDIQVPLSRPTTIEWSVLLEEALKLDPAVAPHTAGRRGDGTR